MQRLFSRKLVSDLTRRALPASLTKPSPQQQSHLFPHPWRSQSNARGFFSNPKKLSEASSTALLSRFRGFQIPKKTFDFNSTSNSFQGKWWRWIQGQKPEDVILGLVIANVTVFLLWRALDPKFMMNNFTISVDNFKTGRLHTLITSAFSHMDTRHLILNMVGLYFFGSHLGQVYGSQFLLKLYLGGGIAGSVFYLLHSAYLASSGKNWNNPLGTPGLGASGAVNAIILLDIFLFPRATLLFNFFIPVPAVLLGVYLIGSDVMKMIEGDTPGSAHLGGAAVAAITWARLRRGRF